MFASAVYVNATPTTLAVHATVLWIPLHAWPQMDRSAMAAASVSVVPVSAQIQSSRVRPVSCVRLAWVSVLSISKYFLFLENSFLLSVVRTVIPYYDSSAVKLLLTLKNFSENSFSIASVCHMK